MRKIIICLLSILFITPSAYASLKNEAFVIETDEESSTDSLNRIAGDIDLGFTDPDQEYQSPDHYRPGPFGHQDAEEKTHQTY